uniref:Uncharacterized protein n=1 Tax=viral metagenome TaxID=1070528 RepID=A0A2V0RAH7_9ZZZZ
MALPAPGLSRTTLVYARCDQNVYRFGRSIDYYAREFIKINSLPNRNSAAIRTASYNLTNETLTLANRKLSSAPLNILTQVIAAVVSANAGAFDHALMLSYIKGAFAQMPYPDAISAIKGTAGDFVSANPLFFYGNDGEIYFEGNIGNQVVISATMKSNENFWVSSERGNITLNGGGTAAVDFNMSVPFTVRLNPGPVKIKIIAQCYLPFDADLLDDARLGYNRFRKYAVQSLGGQFYLPISLDTLIIASYKENAYQSHVPAILVSLFSAYEMLSRCY